MCTRTSDIRGRFSVDALSYMVQRLNRVLRMDNHEKACEEVEQLKKELEEELHERTNRRTA